DYISPEYFCDRKNETEKIISAFKNGRYITLISIRRLGKTILLKHVLNKLQKDKDNRILFIDIMPTECLKDFVKVFSDAIIKDERSNRGFLEKISVFVAGIRGKLVFNDLSGIPSVEVSIADEKEAEMSINKIFEYLAAQKSKYIIAFDEFQQIVNYPEKNTEAILRTAIQHQHKDSFIFSGSSKDILMSMFSDYSKPFYQSSDIMELKRIDPKVYTSHIFKHFKKRGKIIDKNLISHYIDFYKNHTYYVQYFFNRLFEYSREEVTEKEARLVEYLILKEREYIYFGYRNLLTSVQFSVMTAIAKEGGVEQINSGSFLNKYKLSQPSSVTAAVNALIDKQMIYYEDNKYQLYDVYLEKWLKETF
ncbi:MAG: ATP-binding protein, partial [Bacteroidales bacterium]|nr:ATP-binding protein [Bacteroidales bacterium]